MNEFTISRLFFRAWIEEEGYMAVQGTPFLETLVSFMLHCGNEKNIMQFTGVLDINGNNIFEGDIIEYEQHYVNSDRYDTKRKVVSWKFDKWNIFETAGGEYDIRVIGNIFENKDLLQDCY